MDGSKPAAEPNPWRETVRDIFDMLILSRDEPSPLERHILTLIEDQHHDYFCGGKTLSEWEREAVRDAELDELTALGQEMGDYDPPPNTPPAPPR